MGVVVIPLYCRLLERPVHPLDLPVGPRMVDLSQAVVDVVLPAYAAEDMLEGKPILLAIGKLDPVARREEAPVLGYGRARSLQIAQRVATTGSQVSTVVLHEPHWNYPEFCALAC